MPVLSLACHLRHNTPNIPSRYNNEQTTKQTKAINNSYIYINISCKCDTNRAGHFTLDAYASRPVACDILGWQYDTQYELLRIYVHHGATFCVLTVKRHCLPLTRLPRVAGGAPAVNHKAAPTKYKDCLSMYGYSHYQDKTINIMRPSNLFDGNSYTGKTASLYWDGPQV